MLKTILAAVCGFLIRAGAFAGVPGQVLVATPPVYQNGDQYVGVFIVGGNRSELQQKAHVSPGQVILSSSLVYWRAEYAFLEEPLSDENPSTGEIYSFTWNRARTLSTTCTHKALYPIRQGKKYECSQTFEFVGGIVTIQKQITFDRVDDSEICGTQIQIGFGHRTTIDLCLTRDGKWVRRMEVLSKKRL